MIITVISSIFLAINCICLIFSVALVLSLFMKKKENKNIVLAFIGSILSACGVAFCSISLCLGPYIFPMVLASIGLGLSLIAAILDIVALNKKIEKKAQEEKNLDSDYFYIEYSQGAIRLDGNIITIYYNWLPFTCFQFGRISKVLFVNDIQMIEFKGSGWFLGTFKFYFKHFNRPAGALFGKWFVWRRFKLNKRIMPFYEYLLNKVIANNETNKL